jgi:hypothetical protein
MDARGRVVGLSLVFAFVAGAPAAAHAHGPVYVLSGAKLTVSQRDGQNATVRLADPTADATHFSARGKARGGMTTKRLVSQWRKIGFDGRPLATIDPKGDRRQATLVRLGRPRLVDDGQALVADVHEVDGEGEPLADRLVDRADDLPRAAGPTTLSIDAAGVDPPPAAGRWIEVNMVGGLSVELCGYDWLELGTQGTCFMRGAGGGNPVALPGDRYRDSQYSWTDGQNAVRAVVKNDDGTTAAEIAGSMDGDHRFTVQGGWLDSPNRPIHSGSDRNLVGEKGGPLHYAEDFDYKRGAYNLTWIGYVWEADAPAS